MGIITSDEQKTIEYTAAQSGIPASLLMENAGEAIFKRIALTKKRLSGLAAAVLCGKGGNGGDGFVVARRLILAGARPTIVLCAGQPATQEAAYAFDAALAAGVPVIELEPSFDAACELAKKSGVIVDAVFGTGFHGALPPALAALFECVALNKIAFVVSADVPSGVNADTGEAARGAIHADETVCMLERKPAHIFKCSQDYCGLTVVEKLGVPPQIFASCAVYTDEIDERFAARLLPKRPESSHKGTFGKLLCVAGSERYRGAAVLCAMGALSSGAGLVSVASSEKVLDAVAANCPEAVLLDCEKDSRAFASALASANACVLGSGLGVSDASGALVVSVAANAGCPLVLDADGINIAANDISILQNRTAATVITPHVGEFARLAGSDKAYVYANRIACARAFAGERGVIVVLKSDNTVVAMPTGEVFINRTGNSGLAKGGSGDLLCGMIGSLIACGVSAADAAILGVWLHSRAADLAAKQISEFSMTPTQIVPYVSHAIDELERFNILRKE